MLKQVSSWRWFIVAPQRWEHGCVEAKDMRSLIPTGEKLCNEYPFEALENNYSNSRSSSHRLEDRVSVCIHLSQWVRLKRKNSSFSDCVCFTKKPMLCMGKLVNMKLFTIGLLYHTHRHTTSYFLRGLLTLQLTLAVSTANMNFYLKLRVLRALIPIQSSCSYPVDSADSKYLNCHTFFVLQALWFSTFN